MPIAPLDTLQRQTRSAVQNQLRAAQAQLLRETSIVRMANTLLASGQKRRAGESEKKTARKLRQGVYAQHTPDGYQRVSPVQPIQTAPGYRAALYKRALGMVLAALAIAAVCWLLVSVL